MSKILFSLFCFLILSPAFTRLNAETESNAKKAAPKKIVTTFTIIQDMAQRVAGTGALVESITKPGAEIHDYEPTPLDIVKAQSADLVLWNGMGLERWFERFFKNIKNVPGKVITEGIEPMGIIEGPYTGKPNPHSWMSPANAIKYVENIRKALTDLDPINQDIYNKNAEIYSLELKSIDDLLRSKLSHIPLKQRWLVTSEGAFSYLTRDYQLNELFLWPVNADEEGAPKQIQKVVDKVRINSIPVVFSESTISNKAMLQVAKETGVRYGGVLYVDSLTDQFGVAPTYLKLLQYNADIIIKGLNTNEK
ncbi:MAG: metal ABC transporter substrate-binding protein [bacterium]|nr:metal ABC transporter substrate-binding protein [bacterium]